MKIAGILITLLAALFAVAVAATAQEAPKEKQKKTPAPGKETVVMITSMGAITIELNAEKAPVTVKNFLRYVDEKFYDSTIFHRVMKNFMIQGGGFAAGTPPRQKKPHAPITNEAKNGLSNDRGTIAMARTPEPNSATSQFFINVVDNKGLNPGASDPNGYAVFGKVVAGMDVVEKIRAAATGVSPLIPLTGAEQPFQDVPKDPVLILSARRPGVK
jgi:peptidyl-prolyl cis-trans isomerase A (cyclophilin A)